MVDDEASSDIEAEETTMVDDAKLNAFIGKILGDLGGAYAAPTRHLAALPTW